MRSSKRRINWVFYGVFLVFGFLLVGCHEVTTTTTSPATSTTTTTTTTNHEDSSVTTTTGEPTVAEEILTILTSFESRILQIMGYEEFSYPITTSNSIFYEALDLPDHAELHTRDEILNARMQMQSPDFSSQYKSSLMEMQIYLESCMRALEDGAELELGVPFYPNENVLSNFYVLNVVEDGFVTIQNFSTYGSYVIEIGFVDDLLEYKMLSYSYNLNSDFVNPEDSIYYHYYEFKENQGGIHAYSINNSVFYEYSSVSEGRSFSIHFDVDESGELDPTSYRLDASDNGNQLSYMIEVQNNEITSEMYFVYDDHGLLYYYDDQDTLDDELSLYTDISEADGWDYLIGSYMISTDIINASGLFLNDGTILYSGPVYCSVSSHSVTAQLRRTISIEQFTEDELNLSNYGIHLDDERATMSYFESIQVTDVDQVKDDFIVDDFDFTQNQIRLQLFQLIDDSMKSLIFGEAETPEPTGNVAEFNLSMQNFASQLENSQQMSVSETLTTTVISATKTTTNIAYAGFEYNLNSMYYRAYSQVNNSFYRQTTMLLPYDDHLVEFTTNGDVMEYSIWSDDVVSSEYMSYLFEKLGTSSSETTAGMLEINKTDAFTFEITLDKSFFGQNVDVDLLFLQQGIAGLDDAVLMATIVFDVDYRGYTLDVLMTGLVQSSSPSVNISIRNLSVVSCDGVVPIDPLTLTSLIQLPDTKEEIIFDIPAELWKEYIPSGGEVSWFRMEFDEGFYNTWLNADFNIYDADGNLVEQGLYLYFDQAGTYFIEAFTEDFDTVPIYFFKIPDRVIVKYDLNPTEGLLTLDNYQEGIDFYLNIPEGSTDRLVRFAFPDGVSTLAYFSLYSEEFLNGFTWGHMYEGEAMSMYFNVPAGESLTIYGSGNYLGTMDVYYVIFDVPSDMGSMPIYESLNWENLPDIILTTEIVEARLNFTVTESAYYLIDLETYNFGMANVAVDLYSSDGTLLYSDWANRNRTLEPGDYYLIFRFDDSYTNTIVIVPEMIKH